MAIRNTESTIPGGFANAGALGFAVKDGDKFAMVSYLGETLRLGYFPNPNFPITNTYVVFVNKDKVNKVTKYKFELEFFDTNGEKVWSHSKNGVESKNGVFLVTLEEEIIAELKNSYADTCKVKTTIFNGDNNILSTLELTHKVRDFRKDFERRIGAAFVGNKKAFSFVGNFLSDFIQEAYIGENDGHKNIPIELLTSFVYQTVLTKISKKQNPLDSNPNLEFLEELNSNKANNSKSKILNATGICNLKPGYAGMFIPKDKEGISKIIRQISIKGTKKGDNRNAVVKEINSISQDSKIDIYNLLRFPKSNIKIALLSLLGLKKFHNQFENELLNEKTLKGKDQKTSAVNCVKKIVRQIEQGLYEELKPIDIKKGKAEAVYGSIYSRYINKLSLNYLTESDLKAKLKSIGFEFEEIRIKVLDIRSGKPLKNAKTKRIVIVTEDGRRLTLRNSKNSEANFPYYKKGRALTGDTLKYETVAALKKYNYFEKNAFRKSYNKFWNERGENYPSNQAPTIAGLQFIVESYMNTFETDENGIIKLRLPRKLLNKKINIEIGFWEFPIVLEALTNSTTDITRNSENQTPTDFEISWTGGQTNKKTQTLNWSKHLLDSENFGWEVKEGNSNKKRPLKVAQLLKIDLSNPNFSKFYNKNKKTPHFILFGMEWCQPIWNEFDDNPNRIQSPTYLQSNSKYRHLHLVSYGLGLNGIYLNSGKGYGKFENGELGNGMLIKNKSGKKIHEKNKNGNLKYEKNKKVPVWLRVKKKNLIQDTLWRGDNGHQGYDLYGKQGYFVFALHGGNFTPGTSGSNGPNKLKNVTGLIKWEKTAKYNTVQSNLKHVLDDSSTYKNYKYNTTLSKIKSTKNVKTNVQYIHLKENREKKNAKVMAGQITSILGRSGNISVKSKWPTHLHVNVGSGPKNSDERKYHPELTEVLQKVYPENRWILPENDLAPIVFPCHAEANGKTESLNSTGCRFTNKNKIVNNCWAVAELKCPYMHTERRGIRRLQAILKYLNESQLIAETFLDNFDRLKEYRTEILKIAKSKSISVEKRFTLAQYNTLKKELWNSLRNQLIFHPGSIDGAIGDQPTNLPNSKISKGAKLISSKKIFDNGQLSLSEIKFKNNQNKVINSYVESSLIKGGKIVETINNFPSKKPSKTRFSVYSFKKFDNQISIDLENYYKNFQMEESDWIKLESLANL